MKNILYIARKEGFFRYLWNIKLETIWKKGVDGI